MILKRLGNKTRIASEIQKHFPQHQIYIEPFFGAGGMFFNKPKAKYNVVNDLDSDVFNLFQVASTQMEDLKTAFYAMPIHSDLLKYWMKNKETDKIRKALRFLLMSNFTFLGKQDTISYVTTDGKINLYKTIEKTNELLFDVQFANFCFRHFLSNVIAFRHGASDKERSFIYADPPYLKQTSTYSDNGWSETDSNDLFDCLHGTGCKYAMSEFDNPFILEQAKQRNLNVITIGERQNLKNRRTEILVTNYKNHATLFDF